MTIEEMERLRKKVMCISECLIHVGVGVLLLALAFFITALGWWLVH